MLCDIVPMEVCHILLEKPWQYDRWVSHDGRGGQNSANQLNCTEIKIFGSYRVSNQNLDLVFDNSFFKNSVFSSIWKK